MERSILAEKKTGVRRPLQFEGDGTGVAGGRSGLRSMYSRKNFPPSGEKHFLPLPASKTQLLGHSASPNPMICFHRGNISEVSLKCLIQWHYLWEYKKSKIVSMLI
jgi:hypothetical protein